MDLIRNVIDTGGPGIGVMEKRPETARTAFLPYGGNSYEVKKAVIDRILDSYEFPAASTFLELGCGDGAITRYMFLNGFDSYGIDIVPEAIDWAGKNEDETSINDDFRIESIIELATYEYAFFDFIFDGDCIHRCIINDDRMRCFEDIFRILKDGGLLHVRANCVNENLNTRISITDDSYFDPELQFLVREEMPCYYLPREREFINELRSAGFRILELERITDFEGKQPYQSCRLNVNAQK